MNEELRTLVVIKLEELEVIVLSGPESDDGGSLAEGSSGGDTVCFLVVGQKACLSLFFIF